MLEGVKPSLANFGKRVLVQNKSNLLLKIFFLNTEHYNYLQLTKLIKMETYIQMMIKSDQLNQAWLKRHFLLAIIKFTRGVFVINIVYDTCHQNRDRGFKTGSRHAEKV